MSLSSLAVKKLTPDVILERDLLHVIQTPDARKEVENKLTLDSIYKAGYLTPDLDQDVVLIIIHRLVPFLFWGYIDNTLKELPKIDPLSREGLQKLVKEYNISAPKKLIKEVYHKIYLDFLEILEHPGKLLHLTSIKPVDYDYEKDVCVIWDQVSDIYRVFFYEKSMTEIPRYDTIYLSELSQPTDVETLDEMLTLISQQLKKYNGIDLKIAVKSPNKIQDSLARILFTFIQEGTKKILPKEYRDYIESIIWDERWIFTLDNDQIVKIYPLVDGVSIAAIGDYIYVYHNICRESVDEGYLEWYDEEDSKLLVSALMYNYYLGEEKLPELSKV